MWSSWSDLWEYSWLGLRLLTWVMHDMYSVHYAIYNLKTVKIVSIYNLTFGDDEIPGNWNSLL